MFHLPTRVRRTELWRCSPPSQRWVPPLLRLNLMPEKDTETEEGQAHYTPVKDILPFQTEIILWLLHLKVTPNSGISLSKPSALIQRRNTAICPELCVCIYPFHCPGRLIFLFFFLTIFLILLSTIASCCGSKKLLLQAIMAKGRHKLGLVNYCSIPTRIWDLMHERWDFSFHATAARLCPMCLFGG